MFRLLSESWNSMKSLRIVYLRISWNIFNMSWAWEAAFEFLNRIWCKSSVSYYVPLRLSSVILKRSKNKHTYMETLVDQNIRDILQGDAPQ